MTATPRLIRYIQAYFVIVALAYVVCIIHLEWKNLYFSLFLLNAAFTYGLEYLIDLGKVDLPKTTEELQELAMSTEILAQVMINSKIPASIIMEGYCIEPDMESKKIVNKEWTLRTDN